METFSYLWVWEIVNITQTDWTAGFHVTSYTKSGNSTAWVTVMGWMTDKPMIHVHNRKTEMSGPIRLKVVVLKLFLQNPCAILSLSANRTIVQAARQPYQLLYMNSLRYFFNCFSPEPIIAYYLHHCVRKSTDCGWGVWLICLVAPSSFCFLDNHRPRLPSPALCLWVLWSVTQGYVQSDQSPASSLSEL